MPRATRLVTWISLAVVVAFGLMLALGLLVPIYTDEVGSKSQLSRTLIEGGRTISLLPQCRGSWALPLSSSGYPAALAYHVGFSWVGLLGLRVSGFLIVAGAFAGVGYAIWRREADRAAWLRRFASFIAFYAFGVVPLTLITARSEPILIIALGLYAAFPLAWSFDTRRTRWARILVVSSFVVLTSVFYFTHLKALFFTPFVLLSASLTFPWKRPAWLGVVLAFVLLASFQTYNLAKALSTCPEAPQVDAVMRLLTSGEPTGETGPRAFITKGLEHLQKHAAMTSDTMSIEPEGPAWLPRTPNEKPSNLIVRVDAMVHIAIYTMLICAPLYVLASVARLIRQRRARKPLALAVALVACLYGYVFMSAYWSFYNVSFFVGGLAVACALVASVKREPPQERARPFVLFAIGAVQALAVVSMVAACSHYAPGLVALARTPGTVVPGQPAQARIFGYRAERERIRVHAARCGIHGDGARRLVIDDVTLFAFDDLREPFHLIYVTDSAMWGGDLRGEKEVAFLAEHQSPGIISRCAFFPTALVDRAKRDGDYCCVGQEDLR